MILAALLALTPCTAGKLPPPVVCGEIRVFENRMSGRTIVLPVLVAKATDPRAAKPDPVFVITGGPGESAVDEAEGIAAGFAELRKERDLVFADMRGTGRNGLHCQLHGETAQALFDSMFPIERVRSCAAELSKDHDLAQYTTANFIDDLEDVRKALGYAKINLIGGSYGSRAALVYARMHPDVIRSIGISAVPPPNVLFSAVSMHAVERSMQLLFSDCAADAACRAAYPDPAADLRKALANLPRTVTFDGQSVTLTRAAFAERLRYLLYPYPPDGRAQLPRLLHEAAVGRYEQFVMMTAAPMKALFESVNFALLLSVQCSEDLDFVDRPSALRDAAATFLGSARLQAQLDACAAWPHAKLDRAATMAPTRFTGPVLMVGGEVDPATAPELMSIAARTLSHSRVVVLPGTGHVEGHCIETLIADFIRNPSTKAPLDPCASKRVHRRFVVSH